VQSDQNGIPALLGQDEDMANEVEVKIEVELSEIPAIISRLESIGFEQTTPRTEEKNLLFDFANGTLQQKGCALRLRQFGPKTILTYKGAVKAHDHLKIREEIESGAEDFDSIAKIFERLGLLPRFRYEKIRQKYRSQTDSSQIEICVDETPVGCFVEIEGSEEDIERTASALGWNKSQFLKVNYTELYRKKGLGSV
ncbi:MAG: class IV adenylate cyclase, partial [Acidobacteriota bacterium]